MSWSRTVRKLCIGASLTLGACHRCDPTEVDYMPQVRDDWAVSTPKEQGLDPALVDKLYCDANKRETLLGLLVVKNGKLVAESYYDKGAIDEMGNRQSVTKSFTSALVGIAIDRGCLKGADQKMLDFFPESVERIKDPRKKEITIEQMLKMRAGYPWEESDEALWTALWSGNLVPLVADVPLINDPGADYHYSNLTSHWLGVVVARACETDLKSFGQEHLFSPMNAEVGEWTTDRDGYHIGSGEIRITARDMAKFGQLYLDDGVYGGNRILSADWVRRSLRSYTKGAGENHPGPLRDYGYGYQWWSARAGEHEVDFAWGHGGSFLFLVEALDLAVVVTGDPFYGDHTGKSWRNEKAHLKMVAKFVQSLPKE